MSEPRRARRARGVQRASAPRRVGTARSLRRLGGPALLVGVVALAAFLYVGSSQDDTAQSVSASGAPDVDDPRITVVAGRVAPDFSLTDVSGSTLRLADAREEGNVLLFIQEGVACPACFQQMRDLQREAARLAELDTRLITITPDSLAELKTAAVREKVVGMPLLSDSNLSMSRAYDALYVSMHPGRYPGHTFVLVDRGGTIRWRRDYREMYVPVDQVLAAVAQGLGR